MNWSELPAKLKAYIIVIIALATPILIGASWDVFHSRPTFPEGWIILTVLTVLTVPFFHLLPSVNSVIGIGDAYIMAVAMLCGPSACVITTLCHTLLASLMVRNRMRIYPYRVVFNVSSMVCGAWLYSKVYGFLLTFTQRPGAYEPSVPDILLPAAGLTLTFFFWNSLLTSTAISWATGKRVISFWRDNYLPLAIDFSVSAVSAAFIVSLYSKDKTWVPLAVAPLVGVVWGWNKINKAKAMEAERHLKEQEQLYLRTVESLALAVDAKDQTTYGHIRRVRAYAMGLARICGITDTGELMAIETGSLLHDIGKLAIDDYILNKPGPLTTQEFEKMKIHATAGDEILQQVQFPFPVALYVRCHHERWDGSGYPDGLKGEEIPLGARILAIADAFDAIRSSRPYKLSSGIEDSIEILHTKAGTLYDPKLVELFSSHIEEFEAAAEEAAQNMAELAFRKFFDKVERAIATTNTTTSNLAPTDSVSAELVRLAEFCTSLGREVDLPDALPILARRLELLLTFSTCIFYLDQNDGSVRAEHVRGLFADKLTGLSVSLGKGISGWVAAYQRPLLNARPVLEFQAIEGDFSILTDSLAVPLIAADQCIGSLVLYAKEAGTYKQPHLELIQTATRHMGPFIAELRERRFSAKEIEIIDPVTGARRAAYLSVTGPQIIALAEQNQSPLCLLSLHIENFRQIVNIYGWHIGDAVMRKTADIFRAELRETDVLVRYGHHGFVALLPGVRAEQAARCAQRLQQQVRADAIATLPGHNIFATCQTAIASYPEHGKVIHDLLFYSQKVLLEQSMPSAASNGESAANILEFPPRI